VAELVAGRGRGLQSFLCIFVDTSIGGGLVIDSHLRNGLTGNAGAIGSMPLGLPDGHGAAPQLLSVASLHRLEQSWRDAGLADPGFDGAEALQAPWRDVTRAWLDQAAIAVAHAINGAVCLLDLDSVIVDGAIHRSLLAELIGTAESAMHRSNREGTSAPQRFAGTIGADAGALGGALLPLHANFAPDRDLFIKEHQ
jgi:predicted NBD/HSP70 family sugar kinase